MLRIYSTCSLSIDTQVAIIPEVIRIKVTDPYKCDEMSKVSRIHECSGKSVDLSAAQWATFNTVICPITHYTNAMCCSRVIYNLGYLVQGQTILTRWKVIFYGTVLYKTSESNRCYKQYSPIDDCMRTSSAGSSFLCPGSAINYMAELDLWWRRNSGRFSNSSAAVFTRKLEECRPKPQRLRSSFFLDYILQNNCSKWQVNPICKSNPNNILTARSGAHL